MAKRKPEIVIVPQHIVMRYSDRLVPGSDSLADHRKVLKKLGYVWAGKVGRGLILKPFLEQLRQKIPTYLYLATPKGTGFQMTRGQIIAIQKERPGLAAIPDYYKSFDFVPRVGMWMRLKDLRKVGPHELGRLMTISSGRAITETLASSSSGVFIVRRLRPGEKMTLASKPKWWGRQYSDEEDDLSYFDDY